jgi:GTP cyclohydrolase IA
MPTTTTTSNNIRSTRADPIADEFDSSEEDISSDQTSARSMESAEATTGAGGQDSRDAAAASTGAPVITITNPHVCEATKARLLHRKRPCLSSEPTILESDNVTSSTKASVVSAESLVATRSGPTLDDNEEEKLAKMMDACKTILLCMGEDPNRNGLVKTPERWAKALLFMTSGYQMSPQQVTNGAIFEENHDEMVVVRNMTIHSLCEHHMLPFTGVVHVGYIPNGKIVGLSKLARIAELYARRLQVQERLTREIADAVVEMVEPLGVAVVVECTHFCMVMRGVQQSSAVTTTSSVRGCFESNPKTRAEFFSILHNGRIKMC